MTAKVLVVLGTSSSAGKSLLVTALCHVYARRGIRVAPFKAQNMSNNAAVCADGAEIGRAQAVQALAAGITPTVDMNPILIKPEADARSQVIVMGRPWQTLSARGYYVNKQMLWQVITSSLDRLRADYDLVIVEGAGSPVEMNLKLGDLVNMAVAHYAQAPVLLIGDIDRGGIFAQLLGTLWLLSTSELALVRGLVVNKFRGDLSLFADGVQILEEKGGVPVLGVLPYLHDLYIPEEDAVALENLAPVQTGTAKVVDIVVIHLPRISNFDDFDPLAAEPGVQVRYVDAADALGQPDAIILPGTKSTTADSAWLRATGLADAVVQYAAAGGVVVGICGGYQMLGRVVHDVAGVEGETAVCPGLNLLPIETSFAAHKATYQAAATIDGGPGWLAALTGERVVGYEIHMGQTVSPTTWLTIGERNGRFVTVPDGAVNENGRIWGCYLHGLFANVALRRAWLAELGWSNTATANDDLFAASLTRLADTVEAALDMAQLEAIIWDS